MRSGEEQDVLRPVAARQHVDDALGHARLARARRLHEQHAPLVLHRRRAKREHGRPLVRMPRDRVIELRRVDGARSRPFARAPSHAPHEIVLQEKAADRAVRFASTTASGRSSLPYST